MGEEDGEATFGRFLDASWEVFRQQMLEVYSVTRVGLDESNLLQKVMDMELEIKRLRQFSEVGSPDGSPHVHSSNPTSFAPDRPPLVKIVTTNRVELGQDVVDLPHSRLSKSDKSEAGSESMNMTMESQLSQAGTPSGKRQTRTSNQSEADDQEVSRDGPQIARNDQQTNAIRHRLRLRLGAVSSLKKLISGKNLHDAIEALGLTSYSEEEVNDLVNQLADYIDLKFMTKDAKDKAVLDRSNSAQATPFFWDNDQKMGRPIWHWPREAEFSRSVSREMPTTDLPARNNFNVVPLQALMDLFLARDADLHKKIFGPANRKQFQAMKEILLAGDTNRLVAELTFVRINDLAAPPEPINPLMYIEPFVAILILVNGIMIGFQTDRTWEDWTGWKYMEGVLAFFLLLESCMRMYLSGMREFFLGSDWAWNWFDLILMITGVTDVIFQAVGGLESDMFASSLLRFCRLIRLVRVVKIFRLKCMKELRLMVKGLVAGLRTLALAFPLLFAVLYVISGFATMTIGRDERAIELELAQGFENIFWSMFTAFRCFCGECNSAKGLPIHAILAEELDYGFAFVAGYIISYMLVTLGIFNVILAVYVDITMRAAKETEATTSEQHARESIRIARTTRELLKKFAQAYRSFQEADEAGQIGASKTRNTLDLNEPSSAYTDEDIHEIAISKELFLLVIQDRTVQTLMDELDLPPDRANLFEVIDADGSGTMDVTELVQGMLKIRGEVKKSDTVATLLATKALQEMVAEMKASLAVLNTEVKSMSIAQQERSSKRTA
ncbi:unnamed protein product [Durusdinium trenchii]|uniref:EF-hand domain-containing protein n=1 Tax=Durusdinium trenchii TaxID=1381693 RepID=A0ABP0RC46_9DINO